VSIGEERDGADEERGETTEDVSMYDSGVKMGTDDVGIFSVASSSDSSRL
jgi:hypothetical protein